MSTATQQDVNPYASPAVSVAQLIPDASPPYRASIKALNYISRHTTVANLLFPLNAVCFFLGAIPISGSGFVQCMMIAWAVTCFVLWYCTIAAAFASRNFVAGAFAALSLPIPLLGSIAFLAVLGSTKEFMIKNGYRPGLFGFKPEIGERKQMESDPHYVPSKLIHIDGSKRRTVFMLGECVFLLGLLLAVANALMLF